MRSPSGEYLGLLSGELEVMNGAGNRFFLETSWFVGPGTRKMSWSKESFTNTNRPVREIDSEVGRKPLKGSNFGVPLGTGTDHKRPRCANTTVRLSGSHANPFPIHSLAVPNTTSPPRRTGSPEGNLLLVRGTENGCGSSKSTVLDRKNASCRPSGEILGPPSPNVRAAGNVSSQEWPFAKDTPWMAHVPIGTPQPLCPTP
jgi:hypothetical protein